jgi:hypothetical protein
MATCTATLPRESNRSTGSPTLFAVEFALVLILDWSSASLCSRADAAVIAFGFERCIAARTPANIRAAKFFVAKMCAAYVSRSASLVADLFMFSSVRIAFNVRFSRRREGDEEKPI